MEYTIQDGDSKVVVKVGEKGMIFLQFFWKGRPSKSQKGNLNMAWCSEMMFNKIIKAYQDGGEGDTQGEEEPF